ncbi:MAG TPA: hypothetical protein VGO50_13705 [Pyrinomonadaceae bacterium]|jgi:hypothetical protein|nr:hypothetical protein [Pyrinomonadaceae bacterium]
MRLNKSFRLICFAALLLWTPLVSSAQSKADVVIPTASIKTADGYLYIHNTPVSSIMIELKGREVTPAKNTNMPMFFVDGKLVQIITVDIQSFTGDKPAASVENTLEAHKIWESDYLGEQYQQKLKVESEKVAIGDVKALFWGFKRPGSNENYDRDYFLTTAFGIKLLVLSSPIKPSESVAEYKSLLTQIMSTLKVSSKPFDILKIAEDIKTNLKKENKPPR